MKRISLLFSFLMCWSVSSIAQTTQQQADFDKMLSELLSHTVKEVRAKEVMNQKDIIYLDAREKAEYQTSHIPQAKWIGYNTFKKKYLDNVPKDKQIVVYCTVGYRSEKIAEKMKKLGYQNVSNLCGGIFDWKHAGGEVVDTKNQTTEEVHTYNKDWSKWLFNGVKIF